MPPLFDLYVITDGRPRLTARVDALLAGCDAGRVGVQLRMKRAPTADVARTAHALRAVTARHGARLLVNSRLDVARLVGADGVHLPAHGADAAHAREALGPQALIGVSCHDRDELRRAEPAADFATLSPLHAVRGKGRPLGVGGFRALRSATSLTTLALGGVDVDTAADAVQAGADGVAVIRAALGAPDPSRAGAALLDALDRARSQAQAAQ